MVARKLDMRCFYFAALPVLAGPALVVYSLLALTRT